MTNPYNYYEEPKKVPHGGVSFMKACFITHDLSDPCVHCCMFYNNSKYVKN